MICYDCAPIYMTSETPLKTLVKPNEQDPTPSDGGPCTDCGTPSSYGWYEVQS